MFFSFSATVLLFQMLTCWSHWKEEELIFFFKFSVINERLSCFPFQIIRFFKSLAGETRDYFLFELIWADLWASSTWACLPAYSSPVFVSSLVMTSWEMSILLHSRSDIACLAYSTAPCGSLYKRIAII